MVQDRNIGVLSSSMATDESLEKFANRIKGFEDKFGIVFNDKRLLLEALDHRAVNSDKKKRYATAGDTLLDFILFDFLLKKGGYTKGKMDCIRRNLNTDPNLARIGKKIGLKKFITFPDSATEEEKETSKAYYNDAVEALVYLILKDQDLESAIKFVAKNILSEIPPNEYDCSNT